MIKRSKGSGDSVKVTFVLSTVDWGEPVSVVGDFNGWDPLAMPLRKRSNGTRSASIELPSGESYQFRYLAEGGIWFGDPEADSGPGDSIDSLLVV